jgi:hypothetical protein
MTMPPQPSATGPQLAPAWAQVLGVQGMPPHTLGLPPPPQVWGAVQSPQLMMPPQPSPMGPQLALTSAQVTGVVQVGASGAASLKRPPSSSPLLELLELVKTLPPVPEPVPPLPPVPVDEVPVVKVLLLALHDAAMAAEDKQKMSAHR